MSLTIEEVDHIAELARLKLSAEEKELFREQLSEILAYAARLQILDTSSIPPTARVVQTQNKLREDVPRPVSPLMTYFATLQIQKTINSVSRPFLSETLEQQ